MSQIRPSQSYIDESRAKTLLEKWNPVLDYSSDNVAPIEDDHTRLNTAILLENQESWCLTEANQAGAGGVFGSPQASSTQFSGDRYATGDSRLPKILIPMIRRTFPELITNEIVGVQPMSGPVGLAFALRYKYDTEALGASDNKRDGSITGTADDKNTGNRSGAESADAQEAGYQELDTRFTGVSSTALSGSPGVFAMADADKGVAQLLQNFELTSQIPQMVVSFEKTAVEAGTRRLAARWSVELEHRTQRWSWSWIQYMVTCKRRCSLAC